MCMQREQPGVRCAVCMKELGMWYRPGLVLLTAPLILSIIACTMQLRCSHVRLMLHSSC